MAVVFVAFFFDFIVVKKAMTFAIVTFFFGFIVVKKATTIVTVTFWFYCSKEAMAACCFCLFFKVPLQKRRRRR